MSSEDKTLVNPELRVCPHCGKTMFRWYTPPDSTWATTFQYVCFNDECTYYVNGWNWMQTKYNKKASYRHRFNPFNGESGPVPVWSPMALKSRIIPEGLDPEKFAIIHAQSEA